MHAEEKLNTIAAKQHGLLTRAQVLTAGGTRDAIRWKLKSGIWQVRFPGVYALTGAPETWEQAAMAACLAADAHLSHGAASRLWGLNAAATDQLHVIAGPSSRMRFGGVIAHRSGLLPAVDLTVHHRIPVTTVARTIAEVAGSAGSSCGRLVDDALRRRLVTLEAVRSCHARLAGPGRRRLRDLRAVLSERLPGYDPGGSDLEIKALRVLVGAGLPMPKQQHRVRIQRRQFRLDLAYPRERIAIELLGWAYHGGRAAFDDDRTRTNLLVADGWRVVEFTSRTPADEMAQIVSRLISVTEARTARPGDRNRRKGGGYLAEAS